MNADDFVKIIRGGSEKLRVDDIVINTGSQELHGKGMLEVTRKKFKLQVTITEGDKLPEMPVAVVLTKKNKWNLSGLIEDTLRFSSPVWPHHGIQTHWSADAPANRIVRAKYSLHPIDLVPSGWESLSREERKKTFQQSPEAAAGWDLDKTEDNVAFYATLYEYPFETSTWGKKIEGETEHFSFVLQKLESSDLRVALRSKPNYSSQGQEKDWKKFHAFQNALSFMTGINAWPYRIEYWRADQKLIDRITAAEPLAKTIHVPFTEALAFNSRTGSVKWNGPETLALITKFFDTESLLSQEVSYLTFLFRQACSKEVHRDISVLSLCVLFENLVRHIFNELKLEEKARSENPAYNSFDQAKDAVIQLIDPNLLATDEAYKRVQNILRSAEAFNAKNRFKMIVNHFGLNWEHDMDSVFKIWEQTRHPAVHESEYAARTEDDFVTASNAESRIAGAINTLLLKLFGYLGPACSSVLEEKYKQI